MALYVLKKKPQNIRVQGTTKNEFFTKIWVYMYIFSKPDRFGLFTEHSHYSNFSTELYNFENTV